MKRNKKKEVATNPILIEDTRKAYQKKLDLVNEVTKHQNQVVADFLFKKSSDGDGQDKESQDDFDFDKEDSGDRKPPPHKLLSYENWRKEILPAIKNQFLKTEEIVDDDLHEFEDTMIMTK